MWGVGFLVEDGFNSRLVVYEILVMWFSTVYGSLIPYRPRIVTL